MSSDELRQIIQHLDKNHLDMVRKLTDLESRVANNHEDLTHQILELKQRLQGVECRMTELEQRLQAMENAG